MNRKRSIDDDQVPLSSSSVLSSPLKRRRHDATPFNPPQTPATASSVFSSSSTKHSLATPKTPYTPYPLHASDSPSNPFGRKRKERLVHSLPPASSFSKHIALRFQFVRRGISPRQGGIYRVVRVPKNYTFTHLRSLIAWLFDTPARYANGKASEVEYLFEVKSKTTLYSPLYKPGQIKSGATTVKLSNVRDAGRRHSGRGFGSEEDELSDEEEDELEELGSQVESEENGDEEWKWVDEEDFTLAHAWSQGIDPLISIIYYHYPGTQIHITVNTTKLPRQRGISNTPYVFNARGRVHLSPPPLPRPLFTKSVLDTLSSSPVRPPAGNNNGRLNTQRATHSAPGAQSRSRQRQEDQLTDNDADGDTDQETQPFTSNHPFFISQEVSASPCKKRRREDTVILVDDSDAEDVEEENTTEENHDAQPDPSRWNKPRHAFALYLLQFMDPSGFSYDGIDESFFEEAKVYDPFENDDSDGEEAKEIQEPVNQIQEEEEEEQEEDYEGNEDDQQEDDDDDEDEDDIDLAASEKEDEAGEDDEFDAAASDDDDDDAHQYTLGSTPGLTHGGSSSSPTHLSPALFPFAAAHLPSPGIILAAHYPNTKYAHTPAPPRARTHRLRLTRLERRLAKIKKAEFLTKYDEVEEAPAVEVDELEEEEEEEEEKWVMPELKEGEVWDPFGDEVEI